MNGLTCIVLTSNEQLHIDRCIRTVASIAQKIFVIDSYSSDRTVEIARTLGAEIIQRPWKNYADQFQWALENLPVETEWVMRMDADEYLEPALIQEIQEKLPDIPDDIAGIYLKRKVFFMGQWIRHGGSYPQVLLRIWRRGKGRIEQRWMDEHVVLPSGAKTITLKAHLVDDNRKGITFWINKHNSYASREMVDLLNLRYPLSERDDMIFATAASEAKTKRLLKEQLYSKLPVTLRVIIYFFYRYILRLGFLDGVKGFYWHFMQGFWYRLLVDAKLIELEECSGGNLEKMKEALREQHGIDL